MGAGGSERAGRRVLELLETNAEARNTRVASFGFEVRGHQLVAAAQSLHTREGHYSCTTTTTTTTTRDHERPCSCIDGSCAPTAANLSAT